LIQKIAIFAPFSGKLSEKEKKKRIKQARFSHWLENFLNFKLLSFT